MSLRPALAALATSLVLAGISGACSASSAGPTGPTALPAPRAGVVKVDPASGPLGTMFTLRVQGLTVGDTVAFEITFPGEGKAYPGSALTVPDDGVATTTYRATSANQPGVYQVRLTGAPGSLAEGRFTVTDGPPVQSTFPDPTGVSGPSTSRTATSRRSSTSTTVKGGSTTTSSTIRGATTTSTTKKAPAGSSTSTPKAATTGL